MKDSILLVLLILCTTGCPGRDAIDVQDVLGPSGILANLQPPKPEDFTGVRPCMGAIADQKLFETFDECDRTRQQFEAIDDDSPADVIRGELACFHCKPQPVDPDAPIMFIPTSWECWELRRLDPGQSPPSPMVLHDCSVMGISFD